MKTILLSISIMFTATFLSAQNTSKSISNGTTITISVPCNRSEGNVLIGLYTEDTFLKAAPIKSVSAEIVDGKATATLENVEAGTYGISLFQDKNSNKQMDFDENGMPLEPYGVSNNVMNYGPPQWSDAKFEVADQPISMEIRM
jgi:uncharacterized protein (DUF2141 family)